MSEIKIAKKSHAAGVQRLLKQLGYESTMAEISVALCTPTPDSAVFVIEDQSGVVAFISLIYFFYFPTQKQNCRITAIVVDEKMRSCGLGSHLISFARMQAHQHGCAQLEVTTSLTRHTTQAFYETIGFTKASYRYVMDVGNMASNGEQR